jgi:hypothetical protein
MSENKISIRAISQSDLRDSISLVPIITEVNVQDLAMSLQVFVSQLDQTFTDVLSRKIGGFELDEIEVSVEVSVEGRISLLGTGVQGGTTGGMKFVLRRPHTVKMGG